MAKKSLSSSTEPVGKIPKVLKHRATKSNKKSLSSSAGTVRKSYSEKDRNHRAVVKRCVDGLISYFLIVTGIALPKGDWEKVIQLVWNKIFDAGKVEKQEVLMKLKEYTARVAEVVKSMRTVLGKVQVESKVLDVSTQVLQQQFLNEDYSQHGEQGKVELSLQLQEHAAKFCHTAKNNGSAIVDAELELKNLETSMKPLLQYLQNQVCQYCHKLGISFDGLAPPDSNQDGKDTKAEKLLGHPLFSVLEHVDSSNRFSVGNQVSSSYPQQSDPNSEPQDMKPKTHNNKHLRRKKQGKLALKVFFHMYTGKMLPRTWKEAEKFIKGKINDAKVAGAKVKARIDLCATAAGGDQIVNGVSTVFEEANKNMWKDAEEFIKRNIDADKVAGDNVKAMIDLCATAAGVYQIVNDALAALEEAKKNVHECKYLLQQVECGLEGQGLGFNSSILAGQSSGTYEQKWNGFVPEDLQNPMLDAAPLLRAMGCSGGTVSVVAPEAAASLSPGCVEHVENEILLMQLIELFPEIEEDGFKEVLHKMANPKKT